METTNPALSAFLSLPVTCGPPAGDLGMYSLPARVSGQRSPYLPVPHLDCPHQVHSLGRLGSFFTISFPSPAPLTAWGKGPKLGCWVNLVKSRPLCALISACYFDNNHPGDDLLPSYFVQGGHWERVCLYRLLQSLPQLQREELFSFLIRRRKLRLQKPPRSHSCCDGCITNNKGTSLQCSPFLPGRAVRLHSPRWTRGLE